jgi:hypothetical protein
MPIPFHIRAGALATGVSALLLVPGCNKHSDAGSGSPSSFSDAGSASAGSASAAPVASGGSAAVGTGSRSFGSGFEGAIVMHGTTAHGPVDLLIVTKGGKMRIDAPGPDGKVAHSIFNPADLTITILMDSQELAMQMPIPAAGTAGGAAGGTQASKITPTGKHETVAGYDCEDWDIAMANGNRESVCVAQGLSFFDFSAMAGPTGGSVRSWAEELRDKNAFPLRAVEVDPGGKEISRMEVTRIQKKSLDDATFAVPANYHLMRVPGMGAGAHLPGAGTGGAVPGMPGMPGAPSMHK